MQLVRHERADSPSKDINSYGCRKGTKEQAGGARGVHSLGVDNRARVWQVACGKSIERWQRGSSSKASERLPNPLSSLKRQFRVQHLPPLTIFLQAIFPSCPLHLSARLPACLSACLPACLPVQPRANLLGTLFVAAAVDPNLQCFLSVPPSRVPLPTRVCCALPPAPTSSLQLQLQLRLRF